MKSKQVYLGGCRDCFADELMVDGNCIACNVMMGRCIACKSNSKCEVCLSSFRKANDGFKDYCILTLKKIIFFLYNFFLIGECPEGSFIIPRTAKTEEIC